MKPPSPRQPAHDSAADEETSREPEARGEHFGAWIRGGGAARAFCHFCPVNGRSSWRRAHAGRAVGLRTRASGGVRVGQMWTWLEGGVGRPTAFDLEARAREMSAAVDRAGARGASPVGGGVRGDDVQVDQLEGWPLRPARGAFTVLGESHLTARYTLWNGRCGSDRTRRLDAAPSASFAHCTTVCCRRTNTANIHCAA